MNEQDRQTRNRERLEECHPVFSARVAAIIANLEHDGYRPRIQEAWRSPSDQLKDFQSGHSKLQFGFHNTTAVDGKPEALAVDLLDDDHPLTPGTPYLIALAIHASAYACQTGLDWGLPAKMRTPIDLAIANRDTQARLTHIGWDPTHVEAADLTVTQAKKGVRPFA